MHELTDLRVVRVDAALDAELRLMRVLPEQAVWIGRIDDLLADAFACPTCEPMAILLGTTPVGFYRIDLHARSVSGRDLEVPALGLRALFVDIPWQGQGIAQRVLPMILTDLASRHPLARLLALSVSTGNAAAMHLYQCHGFIDRGELYHGGRAGAQRLLVRGLP